MFTMIINIIVSLHLYYHHCECCQHNSPLLSWNNIIIPIIRIISLFHHKMINTFTITQSSPFYLSTSPSSAYHICINIIIVFIIVIGDDYDQDTLRKILNRGNVDGDGKLSFNDFVTLVYQCKMVRMNVNLMISDNYCY